VYNADTFDYVIVGGGTAGSFLTNTLSDDGFRVCLLEAGPVDRRSFIDIPAGYIKNIYSSKPSWGFESKSTPHTADRDSLPPQGHVLGGSSSINGFS